MKSILLPRDSDIQVLEQKMKKRLKFYLTINIVLLLIIMLQRREQVEREVRILREKISVLKIQISTITKGVPITKIEVREDKRSIARSSSPDEKFRSSSVPTSGDSF